MPASPGSTRRIDNQDRSPKPAAGRMRGRKLFQLADIASKARHQKR
jgi:hypothetical protein